ncbi:MAG: peptidase M14 [Coxiella sp. RIFCSPHIGHO2_12_FULL_42_15]|nr:MAG: peptidase M14 [Coxiella sp. RIFCSPHIGHO2_12_FULL_42_15]
MKNSKLQIANATIHPGETLSLALPLPELFSYASLYMPIKVMHGKKAGPCLLVTAAIHGNALNGTEIINRLLMINELKRLQGTLIAIPVVNVHGFMNRSSVLPDGVDLHRCFPGSKEGTHAERMANLFVNEIFSKADVCIDLQTGFINYSNLPQIYVNFNDEKSKQLAKAFNAPIISDIAQIEGTLHKVAEENKKPFLLYEAGEALRFDESSIKTGVKGILNVMRKLEMLPPKISKKENLLKSFFTEKNIWVRSPTSGISRSQHSLGHYVKKNALLCTIQDPFSSAGTVEVRSPEESIIVGKNSLPLVHEGEALYQLAVFPKMDHTSTHLKDWEEQSAENGVSILS